MNNKTDIILDIDTVINKSVSFKDFKYKNKFKKIAVLIPNLNKEKLDIEYCNINYKNEKGMVYLFVVNGVLLKIGSTITTLSKRIQSYNCGKKAYRLNGTCSTTNYFVLQNFLKK